MAALSLAVQLRSQVIGDACANGQLPAAKWFASVVGKSAASQLNYVSAVMLNSHL